MLREAVQKRAAWISDWREALKVEGLYCGPEVHEAAQAGAWHGGGDAGGEICRLGQFLAKFGFDEEIGALRIRVVVPDTQEPMTHIDCEETCRHVGKFPGGKAS